MPFLSKNQTVQDLNSSHRYDYPAKITVTLRAFYQCNIRNLKNSKKRLIWWLNSPTLNKDIYKNKNKNKNNGKRSLSEIYPKVIGSPDKIYWWMNNDAMKSFNEKKKMIKTEIFWKLPYKPNIWNVVYRGRKKGKCIECLITSLWK